MKYFKENVPYEFVPEHFTEERVSWSDSELRMCGVWLSFVHKIVEWYVTIDLLHEGILEKVEEEKETLESGK